MFRALLVLVLAVAQFIAPQASRIAGFGTPIGEAGPSAIRGPEEPAGFAFGIWALIFTLAVVFALRQMLPSRRDGLLYQTVGATAGVLFATACAWMMVAQFYGNGGTLVGLIWLMLLAAARGFFRTIAMRPTLDAFDRRVTLPMFAIYTGWLAAAVWLNSGSALRLSLQLSPVLTPSLSAALLIVCIAALSLVLLRRAHGYLPLGLTTLWALGGIAHANLVSRPNLPIAILSIGLGALVVGYLLWLRRPVKRREF